MWCQFKKQVLIGSLMTAFSVAPAFAATQPQIDTAWQKGLAWLIKHQNGDGSWSDQPGDGWVASASALDAFVRVAPKSPSVAFGFAWLGNAQSKNTDARARVLLTRKKLKAQTSDALADLIAAKNYRAWGSFPGAATSVVDTSSALIAILTVDASKLTDGTTGLALCALMDAQFAGTADPTIENGWPFIYALTQKNVSNPLTKPAILPTALTLLALDTVIKGKPTISFSCGTTAHTATTLTAIRDKGISWLKTYRKNGDGGFSDDGTSDVLSTSIALHALGQIVPTDSVTLGAVDYLIGKQDASGSWANSVLATGYALKVMSTPSVMADADGDAIPDAVEVYLGTSSTVADGRTLISGNAESILKALSVSQSVPVYQSFGISVIALGGVQPYTWTISAGSLPAGLTMSAAGLISGAPQVVGDFSALLSVADSTGRSSKATVNIVVSPAHAEDFDNDGMSNSFEAAYGFNKNNLNDANIDSDGDGLTNLQESQIGSNPVDADMDRDGMKDGFESKYGFPFKNPATDGANNTGVACTGGLSTLNNGTGPNDDHDCDGLTNMQEHNLGTNPNDQDSDKDGMKDKAEVDAKRNPAVNEPALMAIIQNLLLN